MIVPPIDAVYLWVDGAAPGFKEQLQKTLANTAADPTSWLPRRFSDNGELRYSLRSLHQNAPWIRTIYIVTNGQVPAWLNLKHPKIRLIQHSQIYPDSRDLPTFNSLSIEWNLHRIPGLSEHFLHLNDDVFIGRPVCPQDFLTDSGGIKIFLEDFLIPLESRADIIQGSACYTLQALHAAINDIVALNFPTHTPRLLLRTIIEELELALAADVQSTRSSRFRRKNDLLLSVAHAGWLLAKNRPIDQKVILKDFSQTYHFLRIDGSWWWWPRSLTAMHFRPPQFLCLNDDLEAGVFAWIGRRMVRIFLQQTFKQPSPYELA